jgi:serpin B
MNRLLTMLCATLLLPIAWAAEGVEPATSDQAEAVNGNNAFAVELYGQLKSQSGNLFFSPESISTALAMTYAGARGETATEMANTLHFTLPTERLHPAMGGLLRDLNATHDAYQLKVANALWGQQGYTFLDDFLKLTKDNYGAELKQVDFKTAAEEARTTINQWVEQQTENKIKDLIAPGVLTKDTRLVLTNAVYFKADWETLFKKEDTKDEDFHVSQAHVINTPLMHRTGGFNYYENAMVLALEIPYKNKELSMIVFLPKDADTLAAFEKVLTADKMKQLLGHFQTYPKVIVSMQKFKLTEQFRLENTLSAMGMKKAFDYHVANYSGMTYNWKEDKEQRLNISAVIHEAYVDVNEEGTEAAAATAVILPPPPPIASPPSPPLIFRADHPFLFLIRDNRSGSILFMGRVSDPSA